MKISKSWVAIAGLYAGLIIFAIFTIPNPSPVDALTNCETSSAGLDAAEEEMLRLTNQVRAQHGLEPLAFSPSLSRAAAWKSADSSASGPSFSHTDSLGRSPSQRAQDCGYPGNAAENIAYGYPGAAATFNAWLNSDGHRQNILASHYRAIGIGAQGDRWTVKFGLYVDADSPPPPTATATPTRVPPTATPTRMAPTPTRTPTPGAAFTDSGDTGRTSGGSLRQGTNLITYRQATVHVADATRPIAAAVEFVYHYDAATNTWLRYMPGSPSYVNTLKWLETGERYFVGVSSDTAWTY